MKQEHFKKKSLISILVILIGICLVGVYFKNNYLIESPQVTTAVIERTVPKAGDEISKRLNIVSEDCEKAIKEIEQRDEAHGLIVIDPGHQEYANFELESIGPGAEEMKQKTTSGTQGVATGIPEYVLNLEVSLKLEQILLGRGYEVIVIRRSHDVNISNAERAIVANENQAQAFIRIHANGSESPSMEGMMTLCQTTHNIYQTGLYNESRRLSEEVLEAMVLNTGANKLRVLETDKMSGINWAEVPTTIVEMGYMTNQKEDKLMETEEYQMKIAEGIANGIDRYVEQ